MTHAEINTALILVLGLLILYFVSNFRQKIGSLFKKTTVQQYLNIQARIKALEFAPSGIITINSDGLVVAWNPAAASIFGYTEEQMLGHDLLRVIPYRNRALHKAGILNAKAGLPESMIGKTMDLTGLTKFGSEVPIRLTLWKWKDGANTFYTGIAREITTEKQNELRISQLLDMYRNAEEIDNNGVWSWDVATNMVYTSKGFDNIYEVTNLDFRDSSFYLKRVYFEDRPAVEERLRKMFEDKEEYTVEYRIVGADGQPFKIRAHGEPKVNEKGELISIVGTIRKL